MKFAALFILPLIFMAGWFVYAIFSVFVGLFAGLAMLALILITGLYQALADAFGQSSALGVLFGTAVLAGLLGLLYQRRRSLAEAKAELLRVEAERLAIELAAEAERKFAAEVSRLRADALARPWHDRSFSDWRRILFD